MELYDLSKEFTISPKAKYLGSKIKLINEGDEIEIEENKSEEQNYFFQVENKPMKKKKMLKLNTKVFDEKKN